MTIHWPKEYFEKIFAVLEKHTVGTCLGFFAFGAVLTAWIPRLGQRISVGVSDLIGAYVYFVPFLLYFLLTPSLIKIINLSKERGDGWLSLLVRRFMVIRSLAVFLALLVLALAFQLPLYLKEGLTFSLAIQRLIGQVIHALVFSPFLYGVYASVATVFVVFWFSGLEILFRRISRGVEAVSGHLMMLMPIFMFVIGSFFYHRMPMAAFMVWVVALTEKAQDSTSQSASKMLGTIFGCQPQFAWLGRGVRNLRVKITELRRGDVVAVHRGEVIPVDGVVVGGSGWVDQGVLTGERQSFEKQKGKRVLARTTLVGGHLLVRAEAVGEGVVAAKIQKFISAAHSQKTRTQSIGEGIAEKAVAPALAWGGMDMMMGGRGAALGVFNSDLGAGIRTAAPTLLLSHLIALAKRGILVKDSGIFERLQLVDVFIFDITSTFIAKTPRAVICEAVRYLKCRGIKEIVLFSSEKRKRAATDAREFGFDAHFANISSRGKAYYIKRYQEEGRVVALIGDGVADSLALAAADVSFSLRGIFDIGADAAQVVFLDGRFEKIDSLFASADGFTKGVWSNFRLVAIPNALCILGVLFSLWDLGTSLILNNCFNIIATIKSLSPLSSSESAAQVKFPRVPLKPEVVAKRAENGSGSVFERSLKPTTTRIL